MYRVGGRPEGRRTEPTAALENGAAMPGLGPGPHDGRTGHRAGAHLADARPASDARTTTYSGRCPTSPTYAVRPSPSTTSCTTAMNPASA